jgi:hypothetical protein
MTYAPDVTTWRVYSAEQSIEGGQTFSTADEAIAFGKSVTASRWWAERYPNLDAHAIDIREGGNKWESRDGTPVTTSFSVPDRSWLPTSWRVELHPTMLQELVVLHELAHCVSPRHDGDVAGMRKRQVLTRPHPTHGPMFTATLTALVREFGTGDHCAELADAYAHFEVAMATDSELRAAVDRGLQVEEILADWFDETETPSATGSEETTPVVERPPAQIPTWTWGDELRLIRSRPGPKVSQSAVAAAVSAIEPCTRRHIARLENATDLPDDPRLRRIAMGLVAFRGIDPVYARHHLGLVRWDCGVELDELRQVNSNWVALVEHLNALGDARPPIWSVTGDR